MDDPVKDDLMRGHNVMLVVLDLLDIARCTPTQGETQVLSRCVTLLADRQRHTINLTEKEILWRLEKLMRLIYTEGLLAPRQATA